MTQIEPFLPKRTKERANAIMSKLTKVGVPTHRLKGLSELSQVGGFDWMIEQYEQILQDLQSQRDFSDSLNSVKKHKAANEAYIKSLGIFTEKDATEYLDKLEPRLERFQRQYEATIERHQAEIDDLVEMFGEDGGNSGNDEKPFDCTCGFPEIRAKNIIGHPKSCGAYQRLYNALSPKPQGAR